MAISWAKTARSKSQYLKATDIVALGGRVAVTVDHVTVEEFQEDSGPVRKVVLHFKEGRKGLPLNQTNGDRMAAAFGDNAEAWREHRIELIVEGCQGPRGPTQGIRILTNSGAAAPAPVAASVTPMRGRTGQPPSAEESARAAEAALDDDPDLAADSLPF